MVRRRRTARWAVSLMILLSLLGVGGIVAAALAGPAGASLVHSQYPLGTPTGQAPPSTRQAPTLAQREASLTAALKAMAAQPNAPDFAVALTDHRTGVSYTYDAHQSFQTASVVKVEILAELLVQARDSGQPLTADQQALADKMIQHSDNGAASALWTQIGDTDGLKAADTTLGLTETVPGTNGYWGLTTTTVSDQVKLLDTIADPTGPLGGDNQFLLDLMGSVETAQGWGVSAAAHPGEATMLKNGWMTPDDKDITNWVVNSVGRITGPNTDVTMAILTRGHTTLDSGIAFAENIAKLTRADLGW